MARGFRPSLNPAPDGVHAGPERNDSIGTTHACEQTKHDVSPIARTEIKRSDAPNLRGGIRTSRAAAARATRWRRVRVTRTRRGEPAPRTRRFQLSYPKQNTPSVESHRPYGNKNKLTCARHPESRHTHSQSTGKATGSIDLEFIDLDDAPSRRIRTTVVDAGGCSSDTATSPTDTNPLGHTGRHTESRECAPLLWSHHTRVNSTTVIVAGGGSVLPPAPLPILPEVRRSDGEADVAGCDWSKIAADVAGEVALVPPFESPFSGNSPGRPVGERRSQTGAVACKQTKHDVILIAEINRNEKNAPTPPRSWRSCPLSTPAHRRVRRTRVLEDPPRRTRVPIERTERSRRLAGGVSPPFGS